MKKKILACFALIVMCGLCLAGCGAKDVVGAVDMIRYNIASLTKHEISDGVTVNTNNVTQNGNAIITELKDGKTYYGVYNFTSRKIVYALENVESLELTSGENDYITIKKTVDAKTLYDVKTVTGTVVYENQEIKPKNMYNVRDGKTVYEVWDVNDEYECVRVKGETRKAYWDTKVEKGDYSWKGENITPLIMLTGNPDDIRYGMITSDVNSNVSTARIYDLVKGKLVSTYTLDQSNPGEAFSLGKYTIYQEVVEIDSNATKYDYISGTKKYNIHTYKINLISGKKVEIKFNYIVADAEVIVENGKVVGSVVGAYKITKDKTVESKETTLVVDLKVKVTEVANNFYGTTGNIVKVANNRYFAEVSVTDSGTTTKYYKLLNNKFNTVVEITNGTLDVAESTKYGMVVTQTASAGETKLAYMNYDGKYITGFDYKSFVCASENYVMLTKEIKEDGKTKTVVCTLDKKGNETIFAVTDGSETKVKNSVVTTMDTVDGIMVVTTSESTTTGNTVYTFYNAEGKMVGSFDVATGRVSTVYYGANNENIIVKIGDTLLSVNEK